MARCLPESLRCSRTTLTRRCFSALFLFSLYDSQIVTEDSEVGGRTVKASEDEPRYIVENGWFLPSARCRQPLMPQPRLHRKHRQRKRPEKERNRASRRRRRLGQRRRLERRICSEILRRQGQGRQENRRCQEAAAAAARGCSGRRGG